MCSGTILALGSKMPTTAGGCSVGTPVYEWKFDGDLKRLLRPWIQRHPYGRQSVLHKYQLSEYCGRGENLRRSLLVPVGLDEGPDTRTN